MKLQGKWFAYGVGCAAVALGVACATDAYTALEIQQVQVLSGGDCSVPGTPTSTRRFGGTLDLALPDGSTPPYYLPILVVNNLASSGGSAAEEMNDITLQHFTVELSAPGVSWSDSCPPTFDTEDLTDSIPPGGSSGIGVYIIRPVHSQCLQAQVPEQGVTVTAKIKAIGRHGGTGIKSAPFTFPVNVCRGCLQDSYTEAALISSRYPAITPMCASLVGPNPHTGAPCMPAGQDAPIFCCAVTQTVGTTTQGTTTEDVAVCPGTFTGTTSTSTSTSTSTATTP